MMRRPPRATRTDKLFPYTTLFRSVAIFLFARFLLWRNHHRTVTVTRELADSAVILAEELNLLIDGAQDYDIYMLDPDGNVTIWNEGAQRQKGWTAAEMVGKTDALFYPDEDVAPGKRQEERRVGKGCVSTGSYRGSTAN